MPPWGGRDLFRVHHTGHVALTAAGRGGGVGQVGLQFGPEGPRSPAGARGAGGAGSGWGRVPGGLGRSGLPCSAASWVWGVAGCASPSCALQQASKPSGRLLNFCEASRPRHLFVSGLCCVGLGGSGWGPLSN